MSLGRRALASLVLVGVVAGAAEVGLRVAHLGVSPAAFATWRELPDWAAIRSLGADGAPWPVASGLGRWALQPGEPVIEYRLDDRGFRTVDEAVLVRRGGCEVLAAGDSNAFGYGVRAENTFPAELAHIVDGRGTAVAVRNAGICGSDIALQGRWLDHVVSRERPRLVVWVLSPWSLRLDPPPSSPSATTVGAKLWTVADRRLARLALRSALVDRARRRGLHATHGLVGWPPSSAVVWELEPLTESLAAFRGRWREVSAELTRVVRMLRSRGIDVMFVLVPLDVQLSHARNALYREERLPFASWGFVDRDYTRVDRHGPALAALGAALDVPVIDTTEPLRAEGEAAFLPHDYHLSGRGYRRIAETVAPQVIEACRTMERGVREE